jgi:hypothetical protein
MAVRASIVEYDFHTTSTTGGLPLSYAPVLKFDSSILANGLNFTSVQHSGASVLHRDRPWPRCRPRTLQSLLSGW